MMSRSSCRVMSALSRGRFADFPKMTYIANGSVLVDARLEILENGRVDHTRLCGHINVLLGLRWCRQGWAYQGR